MVRIHLKHMQENLALRMILATAAHEKSCLQDWELRLKNLISTPMFVALGKDFESWIDLLERTADGIDVTELLQKFRLTKSSPLKPYFHSSRSKTSSSQIRRPELKSARARDEGIA
jgi:hypothetical protein